MEIQKYDQRRDQPTDIQRDGLTWVGTRDTCMSRKSANKWNRIFYVYVQWHWQHPCCWPKVQGVKVDNMRTYLNNLNNVNNVNICERMSTEQTDGNQRVNCQPHLSSWISCSACQSNIKGAAAVRWAQVKYHLAGFSLQVWTVQNSLYMLDIAKQVMQKKYQIPLIIWCYVIFCDLNNLFCIVMYQNIIGKGMQASIEIKRKLTLWTTKIFHANTLGDVVYYAMY